jgi:hypothetical protein
MQSPTEGKDNQLLEERYQKMRLSMEDSGVSTRGREGVYRQE